MGTGLGDTNDQASVGTASLPRTSADREFLPLLQKSKWDLNLYSVPLGFPWSLSGTHVADAGPTWASLPSIRSTPSFNLPKEVQFLQGYCFVKLELKSFSFPLFKHDY